MQRIDKWLWCARFAKSRTLAASLVSDGRVRVNGERCLKPAQILKPGDVLSIAHGPAIRIVRMLAAAERRGPATEAGMLYDDLSPLAVPAGTSEQSVSLAIVTNAQINPTRGRGMGRPTKQDRRALESLRSFESPDE